MNVNIRNGKCFRMPDECVPGTGPETYSFAWSKALGYAKRLAKRYFTRDLDDNLYDNESA